MSKNCHRETESTRPELLQAIFVSGIQNRSSVTRDCFTEETVDIGLGMDFLPVEIIYLFGRYVNFKDLKSLSAVNKRFRGILRKSMNFLI